RKAPHNLPNAKQPAIKLRRNSDLLAEQLTEPPAAEPGFLGDIDHAMDMRESPEFSQRILHRGVLAKPLFWKALHKLDQCVFEHGQLFCSGDGILEPLLQLPCLPTPKQIKGDNTVVEIFSRSIKKPPCPPGLKDNPHRRMNRR